jgi:Zn-dependent protease with chaperone function
MASVTAKAIVFPSSLTIKVFCVLDAGKPSKMSFVPLAILPSALLAWPLYFYWMGTDAENEMVVEDAIEHCLALVLTIASLIALHRIARRCIEREPHRYTSIVYLLANRSTMEKVWLLLQPLLLALACWPSFTSQFSFVQFSLTGRMLSFFVPSLLFFQCLHGVNAKRQWMSFLPFVVMTTIAAACDGMRFAMGPTAWESDLWSIPSVSSITIWSTVCVVLVSSILASLWIPAWIVWSSGAERLCVGKSDEADSGEDQIRSIHELWMRVHGTSPSVFLWPTNCRMSNAVIVNGLLHKKLLLTDRLMLRFTPREIELIVLHELAHCIRRHGIVRLLPAVVTIPLLAWAMTTFTGTSLMLICSLLAIAFPLLLIATCWWTEWDADKMAIELAIEHKGLTRAEACDFYAQVIQKLYRDNGIRRSSWSHPSCEQRIAAFQGS